eukprot:9632809-Alexandrium_andersonii.AAC.1
MPGRPGRSSGSRAPGNSRPRACSCSGHIQCIRDVHNARKGTSGPCTGRCPLLGVDALAEHRQLPRWGRRAGP